MQFPLELTGDESVKPGSQSAKPTDFEKDLFSKMSSEDIINSETPRIQLVHLKLYEIQK